MLTQSPLTTAFGPIILIELGGTKINLALYTEPQGLGPVIRLATLSGPETIKAMVTEALALCPNPASIGVASFGPICLDQSSGQFGHILKTPKPNWAYCDLLGPLKTAFPNIPIGLDTDVNAAALAEGKWGASQGLSDHTYVTIGTGVGFGIVVNHMAIHGGLHPEAGHMKINKRRDDDFQGGCPFHGDCLEGLISGPAIGLRAQLSADSLRHDDPLWDLIGDYLAQGLMNIALTTATKRIVLGGGVGLNEALLGPTRNHFQNHLGGYLNHLSSPEACAQFITQAKLGDKAGLMGALVLAQQAMSHEP